MVYLFSQHPRGKYLYLAAVQYMQGGLAAPVLGITNQKEDDPPRARGLTWAHRVACRLLLQKLCLTPEKYRLYPTAFRIPVSERQRPLSRKATHLVAVVATLIAEPDVLDLQAHTNEEAYFQALPDRGHQWVYKGNNDNREMSCSVSWTLFHPHYRGNVLPPLHWAWIDQISKFIIGRLEHPKEWDAMLAALPLLQDQGNGAGLPTPTCETALRAVLSVHAKDLDYESVSQHLRTAFKASATRVIQWEPEATWTRPRVPYHPGIAQDWSTHTLLSVDPMWVRVPQQ